MKTILATVLAGGLTLAIAAAAHAQSAQIPTPVNPYPINPVATDGSPLPSQSNAVRSGGYGPYTGRSVASAPFAFVGDVAGAGLGAAGAAVGTGVGAVNGVVGNDFNR